MLSTIKDVIPELTDDTLRNILLMLPLLDENGQNKVFGLICGLLSSGAYQGVKKKRTK